MRQHQVEDEQVRDGRRDRGHRLTAGGQQLATESGLFQISAHELADVAVVFDNEDAAHSVTGPDRMPVSVTVGAASKAADASPGVNDANDRLGSFRAVTVNGTA